MDLKSRELIVPNTQEERADENTSKLNAGSLNMTNITTASTAQSGHVRVKTSLTSKTSPLWLTSGG